MKNVKFLVIELESTTVSSRLLDGVDATSDVILVSIFFIKNCNKH